MNDGYLCFELADVKNQLDNESNRRYVDIVEGMIDRTEDFTNDFVDMRTVIDYSVNDNGLQLYCEDGTGYYWER